MIREKLIERNIGRLTSFRWRSHEVSRIEGAQRCSVRVRDNAPGGLARSS